jgi:hypothetical protein
MVVALGLGVSYAPEALAIPYIESWKVNANKLQDWNVEPELTPTFWKQPNSFGISWDAVFNGPDYQFSSLTFLRIGGVAYHYENTNFAATWNTNSTESWWDVNILNAIQAPTNQSFRVSLGNWNFGLSSQPVNITIQELSSGTVIVDGETGITQASIKRSVPEPSSLLGLTLLGAIGSTLARKKQKTTELS